MNAAEIVAKVELVGGALKLRSDRIAYRLPQEAAHLLSALRTHRDEIFSLLKKREDIPPMPQGVRLVRWILREPPVGIIHVGVVTDVSRFAGSTLCQLDAALRDVRHVVGIA